MAFDQEHGMADFLQAKGSVGDRIRDIHLTLLDRIPALDRIACVIYDPTTDFLRTFVNSTRRGIPINGYEFRLRESQSLSHLADTGECRVIDNIPEVVNPSSPHSKWLLDQGYLSSFTVPMYDINQLAGFLFFNSMQAAAFTPVCQRDVLMYGNLISLAVHSEREAIRSILNSAKVAREFSKLRDFETGEHLERMALYSRLIAKHMAKELPLTDEWIEHVYLFAPLHDVGKIGIPDAILHKPGKHTPEERRVMQSHVELGLALTQRILESLGVNSLPDSSVMQNIIGGHHERQDGSGYPKGLRGDDIPIEARIVAVADIFDALSSERPYKRAWSIDEAFAELDALVLAGKLDARCVAALKCNYDEVAHIRDTHAEPATLSRLMR